MTKLTDLDATFVRWDGSEAGNFFEQPNIANANGILFGCPKCGNHSVLIWCVGVPPHIGTYTARWTMQGTGLNDVTLNPSVNLENVKHTGCEWHGWVRNGDAT